MTFSPADTFVCDTTQLAVWQSDADYNYNRELIAPEVNIFEWLNSGSEKYCRVYLAVSLLKIIQKRF